MRLVSLAVLALVVTQLPVTAQAARRSTTRHECNGTHHHHTTTTVPPTTTTSSTTTSTSVPSTTISTTTEPSTTVPSTTVPTTTEPPTTVPTTTEPTTTEPTTTVPTTTLPESEAESTTTLPSTTVSTTTQPSATVPTTQPSTTLPDCSSTTTIPVLPTTTTTIPGTQEICGNCIDDDGNGLVDDEDPACCEAPVALQVMKAKVRGKKGNLGLSKLRLKTKLGGAFAPANPAMEPMRLQITGDDGTVVCTALGPWVHKGKKFRFLGGATGLTKGMFRVKRSGVALKVVGRDADLHTLPGSEIRVAVRIGDRCARGLAPLRKMPKALVAP